MRAALGFLLVAAVGCASGNTTGSEDAALNIDANLTVNDASVNAEDAPVGSDDAAVVDASVSPDATVTIDAPPPPDANPANPPVIDSVVPNNSAIPGGEAVQVNGSNFTPDIAIAFGATTATCTYVSTVRVDCTAPAGGAAGAVSIIGTQAGGSDTLVNAFTYWDTNSAVDGCALIAAAADQLQNSAYTWQAHILEAGITDVSTGNDPPGAMLVQYGIGPAGTDPSSALGWTWTDATATAGYGPGSGTYLVNNDQYESAGTVPLRGQYAWSFRASVENGVSWRFCNLGTMTSRSPITCSADATCFADELCLDSRCRVDCSQNSQCFSWGPACGGLGTRVDGTTLELYCTDTNPGGGGTGATCTTDSECENAQCLVGITDQCTLACNGSDAACGGGGQLCAEFADLGLCSPGCTRNADCDLAGGKFCVINGNNAQNRYDQICVVPTGTDPAGADCSVTIGCQSGLCLTSGGMDLCTEFCVNNGDCPAATPNCGQATITLPGGSGTQTLDVCVP